MPTDVAGECGRSQWQSAGRPVFRNRRGASMAGTGRECRQCMDCVWRVGNRQWPAGARAKRECAVHGRFRRYVSRESARNTHCRTGRESRQMHGLHLACGEQTVTSGRTCKTLACSACHCSATRFQAPAGIPAAGARAGCERDDLSMYGLQHSAVLDARQPSARLQELSGSARMARAPPVLARARE